MKNKEIHATSPLRQERNTSNLHSFLQRRNGRSLGNWCILFMKSLTEKDLRPGMILLHCSYLRPFLEYIEETHGITTVTGLERSHVEGYVAAVHSAYEAGGRTFIDASHTDDLHSAVRMFCQYLYSAGVVAQDYGQAVPADKRVIRG